MQLTALSTVQCAYGVPKLELMVDQLHRDNHSARIDPSAGRA